MPLFQAYLAAFRDAAAARRLEQRQPDLNQALAHSGNVWRGRRSGARRGSGRRRFSSVLEEAVEALNQFRAREGAELARLHSRAEPVHSGRRRGDGTDPLASDSGISEPPAGTAARVAGELPASTRRGSRRKPHFWPTAAISARRSRVSRSIPSSSMRSWMPAARWEKSWIFCLQEMNRETNTILSKTSGIGELGLRITDLALAFKAAIEKIREQALNLE